MMGEIINIKEIVQGAGGTEGRERGKLVRIPGDHSGKSNQNRNNRKRGETRQENKYKIKQQHFSELKEINCQTEREKHGERKYKHTPSYQYRILEPCRKGRVYKFLENYSDFSLETRK
jgi:hypothetical protein